MDMAVLVAAQGEMVDRIAVHVEGAVVDTEKGVQALVQAVEIQKKTKKVIVTPNCRKCASLCCF